LHPAASRQEADVAGGIPDRVAQFIARHIDSVEQLEVLLLLRGDPGRAWTADELGATLRSVPDSVLLRLRDLHAHGLVEPDGETWRFSPAADGTLVGDVEDCWKARRAALIALIFAEPGDDPARDFADAFRLRKDGS
jgi:hypothetical protein